MVFCVKYRKKILCKEEVINGLLEILFGISERYWFEMEKVGTDGDHIHIFVGASPRYSPSRVVQIVKSISGREIFKRFPEIRKELWGGEFWSDGGYVGTVGEGVTEEIIKKYIETQGTEEERRNIKQLKLFDVRI